LDFFQDLTDMLQLNLSETEIQQLNYERYHYPCPIVQKRIQAVYVKGTNKLSAEATSKIVGLNRKSVNYWIHIYKDGGFKALCQFNYGTNKSELESYSTDIMKSFTECPPMNSSEAVSRIKDMTGICRSPTQVRTFMKRHGFRYIKTGHIPAKADVEKQQAWLKSTLGPAIEQAKNQECYLFVYGCCSFYFTTIYLCFMDIATVIHKGIFRSKQDQCSGCCKCDHEKSYYLEQQYLYQC